MGQLNRNQRGTISELILTPQGIATIVTIIAIVGRSPVQSWVGLLYTAFYLFKTEDITILPHAIFADLYLYVDSGYFSLGINLIVAIPCLAAVIGAILAIYAQWDRYQDLILYARHIYKQPIFTLVFEFLVIETLLINFIALYSKAYISSK
jgi:hypothetical protein